MYQTGVINKSENSSIPQELDFNYKKNPIDTIIFGFGFVFCFAVAALSVAAMVYVIAS